MAPPTRRKKSKKKLIVFLFLIVAVGVTVLGFDVANTLFPDESAVGKSVRIKGHEVEVVGVLFPMGSFFWPR